MTKEVRQTAEFRRWLGGLHDRRAAERIALRIVRLEAGLLGDAKFFDGIGELRIDHGPGYRLYFCRREDVVIILLCGGDKSSQARDIRKAIAMAKEIWMPIETFPFDAAEYLGSPEAQAELLRDAFETGDAGYIAHALGVIVRARGMSQVAREAGLSREALYKALSPTGNPTLSTLLGVTRALNIRLEASVGPTE